MASERSTNPNRPLKPTLASNRTARTPIAPRVAGSGNATPPTKPTSSRPTPTIRSEPGTPRGKQTSTPINNVLVNTNVTPRSSARASRRESANESPRPANDALSTPRPLSALRASGTPIEGEGNVGINGRSAQESNPNQAPLERPKSLRSGNGNTQSPLLRSPGLVDLNPRAEDEKIDSRFFHASDVQKQEPKKAQFFHADGKQEAKNLSPNNQSPVLSALSEQRSSGPWIRPEYASPPPGSSPMRSPALSALSGVSPFFAPAAVQSGGRTSPTQSKENIHLSYRKGVSQIIGTRPSPTALSTASERDVNSASEDPARKASLEPSRPIVARHRKTPSVSSIDSSNSFQPRKRSTTTAEPPSGVSTLVKEGKAASGPHVAKPPQDLPSIDTSLDSPGILLRTESGLSPTKATSDLAAEARRERKVLDLEISNSSLMAINTSLEREVRRQKAELKRFRRLSRAGRFSFAPGERMRTLSEDLSALTEEYEDEDYFGPVADVHDDDPSDDDEDDEDSITSSAGPLSPAANQDRLAKDERRLRVDLEKHKELLMQSQAVNQSIKRCMFATEDMINEGKKALEYHVRVSDIKLGGRVLSTHEDVQENPEIEVEDDMVADGEVERGRAFLETWTDIGRRSLEGSEAEDRDSGIEVDRPSNAPLPLGSQDGKASDSGRPPGLIDMGRFGSFS